jgi:hypothetical protein
MLSVQVSYSAVMLFWNCENMQYSELMQRLNLKTFKPFNSPSILFHEPEFQAQAQGTGLCITPVLNYLSHISPSQIRLS